MDRRVFLDPRHLAQAAGNVWQAVAELQELAAPPAAPDPETLLLRCGRQAMATTFEVLLPFDAPEGVSAAEAALDEIDRLEAQLTVYRDDSEVSQLNRRAATEAVQVEPRLFALLQQAAQLARDSGGAFDISTGALTKAWGFFRRCGRVPSADERQEVLQRVGMHHVVLDAAHRSVRYLRRGLELNLGSIGKGYALDRAAAVVRDGWGLPSALLHGGKSSIYAVGSVPGSTRGWQVAIRHPWEERTLATVRLRDRGLATSAATFQHLEHEGKKLGHILDPRTGWPASGLASATVLAPTAAEADALATASYIRGIEWTRGYCAEQPRIGAVLLPEGDAARLVVVGVQEDEIEVCAGTVRRTFEQ